LTRSAAGALAKASFFSPAVDLLEHVRHYTQKGHDQATQSEEETDGLPERSIGREPGLETVAEERHTAGDKREEQESCCKNVQVTGHCF
jgi:hypothetical protein